MVSDQQQPFKPKLVVGDFIKNPQTGKVYIFLQYTLDGTMFVVDADIGTCIYEGEWERTTVSIKPSDIPGFFSPMRFD